jgi:valyl-tRNA synthetase
VAGNTPGNDPVIYEEKIKGYRNFSNKIWNAARFVMMQTGNYKLQITNYKQILNSKDKKLLNDLGKLKREVTKLMDNFRFYSAAEKIYHYFWHIFCDKIIEEQKPRLKNQKESKAAQYLLLKILLESLKLLHPFMPFITEEIYQKLPIKNKKRCIMIEEWTTK